MQENKPRNVSLDAFTYEQLTSLARAAKMSRAEYIRHFVRGQMRREYTIKNGTKVPISDLDSVERLVDSIGAKFGVKIDMPFLRFLYDLATGKQKPEELKEPELG